MVSQFILGHFKQERSRLTLVDEKITLFRANEYPKIENLSIDNLSIIKDSYETFLQIQKFT